MKNIQPDPLKDQFFLTNKKIINKLISAADLTDKDTVLEIGAGTGNLTRHLAKHAGKVIAFEIDERFKPFLNNLPQNVDLRFENAWDFIQLQGKFKKKKKYNKIVSNPPYSFIEPLLHNLTFLVYDRVILIVPKKTLKTIKSSGIFSSFFKVKILFEVPRSSFDPIPKTNSVAISLLKLPDPIETKNPGLFLRQYVYAHENQLVKNSIMEGIIKYVKRTTGKMVTKNKARKMITDTKFPTKYKDTKPGDLKLYTTISTKFKTIL